MVRGQNATGFSKQDVCNRDVLSYRYIRHFEVGVAVSDKDENVQ